VVIAHFNPWLGGYVSPVLQPIKIFSPGNLGVMPAAAGRVGQGDAVLRSHFGGLEWLRSIQHGAGWVYISGHRYTYLEGTEAYGANGDG
jgi:hypothetical protein